MLAIGNAAEARQRPKGEKEASRGPPWVHGCSIHASRTAESVLPFQGGYRRQAPLEFEGGRRPRDAIDGLRSAPQAGELVASYPAINHQV